MNDFEMGFWDGLQIHNGHNVVSFMKTLCPL